MDGYGIDALARSYGGAPALVGPVTQATGNEAVGVVELSAADLPAFCPNRKMPLWSAHPKVFLDVVNEQEATCPYCGTRYRLERGTRVHDHEFGALNLHQHRIPGMVRPGVRRAVFPRKVDGEAANVAGDRYGNTTLELMTRWLTGRQGG